MQCFRWRKNIRPLVEIILSNPPLPGWEKDQSWWMSQSRWMVEPRILMSACFKNIVNLLESCVLRMKLCFPKVTLNTSIILAPLYLWKMHSKTQWLLETMDSTKPYRYYVFFLWIHTCDKIQQIRSSNLSTFYNLDGYCFTDSNIYSIHTMDKGMSFPGEDWGG
jgi:hypothetical protein